MDAYSYFTFQTEPSLSLKISSLLPMNSVGLTIVEVYP